MHLLKPRLREASSSPVSADKELGIKTKRWFFVTKPDVTTEAYQAKKSSKLLQAFAIKGMYEKSKEANDAETAASTSGIHNERPATSEDKAQTQGSQNPEPESGEAQAQKIIVENPSISGPTLLNILKSKGLTIVPKLPDMAPATEESKEADSASTNSQALRSKPKESTHTELVRLKFLESSPQNDAVGWTRFRCVLIQEGLGNANDLFYYSRPAIESGLTIFEGKKIYADHPAQNEEATRPERSVRDILGHFENLSISESEGGQAQLEADVCILPDESFRWARGLLRHAVEFSKKYPDKEFIGLSINAAGEAEEQPLKTVLESAPEGAKLKLQDALASGAESVRVVSKIEDAVSCDLVTEAGAGGKVLNLIEQEKSMNKKNKKVKESEGADDKEQLKKKGAKPGADEEVDEAEGADAAEPADGEGADDHADKDQDVALIKKMIAKYMGDGDGQVKESEAHEAEAIAHECMKQAMEMGMSKEHAMQAAEAAVKAAKKLQMQSEAESKESKESKEESKESKEHKESKEESKESKEHESKESHKESMIKAVAKIALLENENKKLKFAQQKEALLEASKLGRAMTKLFLEADAADPARNIEQFGRDLNKFKEALKGQGGEAGSNLYSFITTEKTTVKESTSGKALDFSDCKK